MLTEKKVPPKNIIITYFPPGDHRTLQTDDLVEYNRNHFLGSVHTLKAFIITIRDSALLPRGWPLLTGDFFCQQQVDILAFSETPWQLLDGLPFNFDRHLWVPDDEAHSLWWCPDFFHTITTPLSLMLDICRISLRCTHCLLSLLRYLWSMKFICKCVEMPVFIGCWLKIHFQWWI